MPQIREASRKFNRPGRGKRLVTAPIDPQADRQRAIYEALRELGEVVYAVACPDGLIKIGHTGSLRERRRGHGVDFTDILAVMSGTYDDEQAIHARFNKHLVRGREYYRRDPEILEFVNGIRERAGIPTI